MNCAKMKGETSVNRNGAFLDIRQTETAIDVHADCLCLKNMEFLIEDFATVTDSINISYAFQGEESHLSVSFRFHHMAKASLPLTCPNTGNIMGLFGKFLFFQAFRAWQRLVGFGQGQARLICFASQESSTVRGDNMAIILPETAPAIDFAVADCRESS